MWYVLYKHIKKALFQSFGAHRFKIFLFSDVLKRASSVIFMVITFTLPNIRTDNCINFLCSLRVNLDMGKAAYGWMIMKDDNIPGTVVRTSTIPEELGRLVYLLTDKTGISGYHSEIW